MKVCKNVYKYATQILLRIISILSMTNKTYRVKKWLIDRITMKMDDGFVTTTCNELQKSEDTPTICVSKKL